ncbi:cobalt-precorrin 5A hydrolase [Aceticella autotrophica]|uniref:Cobalt-precorrin 5A hydrolase n=1 Tax=Aceticella autotrophica TaxID=2755338 RepID=A0A975AX98_9THEO|nr:cobalt-precorrin 5A hydrolase [Aceticella autotrophica]QSZ28086.1 cobalt-precorrin 5A hydrolase [Aceticella autotrophica]
MKTAVIALTKNGTNLARKLSEKLNAVLYVPEKFAVDDENKIEGNLSDFVKSIFGKYDGFIFIMAAGIVVRVIAPLIKSKKTDPAVVVLDERGKFAISLLSGHIGGANDLSREVSKAIGAQPVITTATDVNGLIAIDVIAKEKGYYIENFEAVKKINSALVNGDKVVFIIDKEEKKFFNDIPCIELSNDTGNASACVYVTAKNIKPAKIPFVILRPKNIVFGIGCKRNTEFEHLLKTVKESMDILNLSLNSVKNISTMDIKKDEECINKLAEYLQVPVKYYIRQELEEVEHLFPVSEFVKKTVGAGSVARPSAYLLSENGQELLYTKGNGITLAIYKISR